MTAAANFLENDNHNACIGCGPTNPIGLKLQFRRESDHVVSHFTPDARHQGWPERLHSGILYLAMLETANWTIYGLHGRPGCPTKTSPLELLGRVPIGATITLAGRLDPHATSNNVRVEARLDHNLIATLQREFDFPTRTEFAKRMGYQTIPQSVHEFFHE